MKAMDLVLPAVEQFESRCLGVDLEASLFNTLWVTMKRHPDGGVQNFSLPLLHDLSRFIHAMKSQGGHWNVGGQTLPTHYAVMRSAHPDYFSLGGDLAHFRDCIRRQDRSRLHTYSTLCLDMMHDWATCSGDDATTVALVQGRALGGGFEAALSADVVIAEEQSEFGLPEIMFGLFPCTGAMSLLSRRVGVFQAEKMMTNGRIYSAAELKAMGVIDEVCARGEGERAVRSYITSHARNRRARLMVQRSRHRLAPLDYAELAKVVDEWADLAMELGAAELRVMDMLIRMQAGGSRMQGAAAQGT